ncbi:MAG TPA: hypothetical protein IAB45_06705 [Candidatus Onthousia faecavium]|nr:hypothetical protein [Candidatus Onthousia faecavium]
MAKNYGFQNEWDFFNYLNGKKVGEINQSFKEMLTSIYDNLTDDMNIKCYVDMAKNKEDLWITINSIRKNISIKMGSENTFHTEYIYNFTDFLERQNVPMKIINDILDYHFLKESSVSVNANNIIEKITLNIYKQKYHKKINNINLYFQNNESLLKKLINRFVIGKNDLIIHGTVENFSYITKEEIIKVLLANKIMDSSSVHFSHLYFQAKSRKDEVMRFFFQIKWYKLEEDISIMRQKKEH